MGDYDRYSVGTKSWGKREEKAKALVTYSVTNSYGERFEITPGVTRVIFIGEGYYPTPLYPRWDSQHACVGTVTEVSMTGGLTVKWDNGSIALKVQGRDLALHQGDKPTPAQEENPNIAFKLEKSKETPGKVWSKHSGWEPVNFTAPTDLGTTDAADNESESIWPDLDDLFTPAKYNIDADEYDR